jgi:hypothetical protein
MISLFVLISLSTPREEESGSHHTPAVIIEYVFRYQKSLLDLFLETNPSLSLSLMREEGNRNTGSESMVPSLCLLDGISQVTLSVKSLLLTMEILRWNQEKAQQQKCHEERTGFILRYLQTLYAPSGKLYPVIQQVESMLGSRQGIHKVVVICRDTSDDSILYDSNGTHSGNGAVVATPSPSRGQSRLSERTYDYSFQVYEITGMVSLSLRDVRSTASNTSLELDEIDQRMFEVLTSITGRRIYELYRGKRNKRILVTLQREIEMYK